MAYETVLALDIDQAVSARLQDASRNIAAPAGARIYWAEPRNIHVVLKSLGDIPKHRLGGVSPAFTPAKRMNASPVNL